jgi:hypothetical protein
VKYYRIIVKDNENSPTSYVYIATIDENNGLSRINGLEVAETVVHSKIEEIVHAFLEVFLEDVKSDIETSIILKDIRQKLTLHDVQIQEVTKNIDERISGLINGAPEVLDTLKELSDALNNDPDFSANILQQLVDLGIADSDLKDDITGINTALAGKVDKEANKGLSTNDYTTNEKNKLTGIEENANLYTHPVYTARTTGFYKVTVDATGHLTAVTAVAKADITGLGIPAQDTTYGIVTKTADGLAPKLPNETTTTKYLRQDGTWAIPPDTKYTHPTQTARTSGLYKITVDATGHITAVTAVVKADITGLGIPAQDTVYTHPAYTQRTSALYKITVDATGHVSAATTVSKGDITGLGIPSQDTTYGLASKTADGLAPKLPDEITTTKYLRQDGTWAVPPDTTYDTELDTKLNLSGGTMTGRIQGADKKGSWISTFTSHTAFYIPPNTDPAPGNSAQGVLSWRTAKGDGYAINNLSGENRTRLQYATKENIDNNTNSSFDVFSITEGRLTFGMEPRIPSKTNAAGNNGTHPASEAQVYLKADKTTTYTKEETNTELNKKANTEHTHTKSEITDFPTSMTPTAHTHDDRYYTETEIDTLLDKKLNLSGGTITGIVTVPTPALP